MARSLMKSKGRRESGPFIAVPRSILDSREYADLSSRAIRLLFDVYAQFRGYNNGDLSVAWSLMKPRGWTSKDQLTKARDELLEKGWLGISRRPRARRDPELYYLTFLAIDDCKGKLDVQATVTPTNEWKNNSLPRSTGKLDPQHGAKSADERHKTAPKAPSRPAPRVNKSDSLPRPTGPFLDLPHGAEHPEYRWVANGF